MDWSTCSFSEFGPAPTELGTVPVELGTVPAESAPACSGMSVGWFMCCTMYRGCPLWSAYTACIRGTPAVVGADLICPMGVREASVWGEDVGVAAKEGEGPSCAVLQEWLSATLRGCGVRKIFDQYQIVCVSDETYVSNIEMSLHCSKFVSLCLQLRRHTQ